MSDTPKEMSAAELAEAGWRAADERKAEMELAHTAASQMNAEYMRQRIAIDAVESVDLPAHRNRVEIELTRQGDLLARIATALEALAFRT